MSFYVNNTELKDVYFNSNMVKTIYYNNELIWKNYEWGGWSNATWKDIYDLCKAKQAGKITEWPSDVVLGATKTTTISSTSLGSTSAPMMLIGIDIDGPGVLTFQMATVFENDKCIHSQWKINEIYNGCNAKDYIKPLMKGVYSSYPATEDKFTYAEYYIWIPSLNEMGITNTKHLPPISEYTQGVSAPYPYYNSSEKRIKKNSSSKAEDYWVRSYTPNSDAQSANYPYPYINSSGNSSGTKGLTVKSYYAPAFAIG